MLGKVKVGEEIIEYSTTFDNLKFKCAMCGYCCSSQGIEIKKDELQEIKNITGKSDEEIGQKAELFYETSLLKQANKRCAFLNDKKLCEVYKTRPLSCKTFPFIVTFTGNKAIIDVSHECVSIVKQDAIGLDYNFDELVKDSARYRNRFYEEQFMLVEKEIKQFMDSDMAKSRLIDFVFHNAKKDPIRAISLIDNMIKTKNDKLDYKTTGSIIENAKSDDYVLDPKIIVRDYHIDNMKMIGYCLKENKEYVISYDDGFLFDNNLINFKELTFSNDARLRLIDYIKQAMQKEQSIVAYNVKFSMIRKQSTFLMLSIIREVLIRLVILSTLIANTHNNNIVERYDVDEALLISDSMFIKSIMEAKV